MKNKCTFCELEFEHVATRKVIRGEPMLFCSESCYRLWFYKMPKDNRQGWLPTYTASVKVNNRDLEE